MKLEGELRYSCTHSYPPHWMEVTSQLHVLTALFQEKKPGNYWAGWGGRDATSGRSGKEKNLLPLLGMEQGFLDCPTHTIDILMNKLYSVLPEHLSMFFTHFSLLVPVVSPRKLRENFKATRATYRTHHKFIKRTALTTLIDLCKSRQPSYEGWNFNSGNYLFTTDTK